MQIRSFARGPHIRVFRRNGGAGKSQHFCFSTKGFGDPDRSFSSHVQSFVYSRSGATTIRHCSDPHQGWFFPQFGMQGGGPPMIAGMGPDLSPHNDDEPGTIHGDNPDARNEQPEFLLVQYLKRKKQRYVEPYRKCFKRVYRII